MSDFIVDVESDGPIPNKYSIVCFGSVIAEPSLSKSFYGKTNPISNEWVPEALAVSGFSRDQHLQFDDPKEVMMKFKEWILSNNENNRPTFISDNLAYDWQWINYYFHYYLGENPFGFSGRRIGDIYCGLTRNLRNNKEWKRKFRRTHHSHVPTDDAKGNAEAFLAIKALMK